MVHLYSLSYCHNITEILLKVALNTITLTRCHKFSWIGRKCDVHWLYIFVVLILANNISCNTILSWCTELHGALSFMHWVSWCTEFHALSFMVHWVSCTEFHGAPSFMVHWVSCTEFHDAMVWWYKWKIMKIGIKEIKMNSHYFINIQ